MGRFAASVRASGRASVRFGLGAVGLIMTGCYPPPEPFWLLDEEPLALGYEIEVIEEGPLSASVPPVRPHLRRKEPMPLDTVLITPIVATRDEGVLGPSEFVPAWFLCPLGSFGCEYSLSDPRQHDVMMQPCTIATANEGCLAGFANPLPLVWPLPSDELPAEEEDLNRWLFDNSQRTLLMVGGSPGGLSTADCLSRLEQPQDGLRGCAIGRYMIRSGPMLSLIELFDGIGALQDVPYEIPELENRVFPDTAPRIPGIEMEVEGRETSFDIGEVITVPHDVPITLDPDFGLHSLQNYLDFGAEGLVERQERGEFTLYFDEPAVPRYDLSGATTFEIPGEIDELTAYMFVGDSRNGWTWIEIPIVATD